MLRRWSMECERLRDCDRSEATWREVSSILPRSWAELSGNAGETLAVVGWGVTSQIVSARCESEFRLPSVWPASMA